MPNPRKLPQLKAISGTQRPDRADPADPPQYDQCTEFPSPPQHLNTDGVAIWSELGPQLVGAGVLQVVDLYALEQLAVAWQQFRKKARADMEITASEHNALKALWQDFGLTPAARRRVVSSLGDSKAPPANRFASHGKRPA